MSKLLMQSIARARMSKSDKGEVVVLYRLYRFKEISVEEYQEVFDEILERVLRRLVWG